MSSTNHTVAEALRRLLAAIALGEIDAGDPLVVDAQHALDALAAEQAKPAAGAALGPAGRLLAHFQGLHYRIGNPSAWQDGFDQGTSEALREFHARLAEEVASEKPAAAEAEVAMDTLVSEALMNTALAKLGADWTVEFHLRAAAGFMVAHNSDGDRVGQFKVGTPPSAIAEAERIAGTSYGHGITAGRRQLAAQLRELLEVPRISVGELSREAR